MNNIIDSLPKMLTGSELEAKLTVMPAYHKSICNKSAPERLMKLNELYDIYLPSTMSFEIYSKLYLALVRSLQKKIAREATVQRNENFKMIKKMSSNGIIGGSDSFTIIGTSGIGKSSAINRAIDLISENGIIETLRPMNKIIPCLVVQCPFDASVKGLLLEILRKVDEMIGSDYYKNASKARVTTDLIIGCVSQVALNHIGLLVVDEIQNVVNNKHGKNLVAMLTQLINNSGISICMVGTPESLDFFEQEMQLARRSMGLKYGVWEYNRQFKEFCKMIFEFQYVKHYSEINESITEWLYQHSGGVISVVVSLIHDAQELAILNGTEKLNMENLTEAYTKRMSLLHGYIKPSTQTYSKSRTRKRLAVSKSKTISNECDVFIKCSERAKIEVVDVVELLKQYVNIEEVSI